MIVFLLFFLGSEALDALLFTAGLEEVFAAILLFSGVLYTPLFSASVFEVMMLEVGLQLTTVIINRIK